MEKRLEFIDILKGIGIIFVIAGHLQNISTISRAWIYSFHMPLFFFISGVLFRKSNLKLNKKDYILKKVKSLLYPYLTISIFFIVFNILTAIKNHSGIVGIKQMIFSYLYSAKLYETNYVGALWFLTCLFSVEIMFYFIAKISNKTSKKFIVIFIGIIGLVFGNFSSIRLPFGLDIGFTGLVFYYLGYVYKNTKSLVEFNNKYYFLMIIPNVIFMALNYRILKATIYKGRVDMLYLNYGNYLFFYISAITGILFLYGLSEKIHSKLLAMIGRNSLVIMGFHLFIMTLLTNIISKVTGYNLLNNSYLNVNTFIIFILTILASTLFSHIIYKYLPSYVRLKK